MSDFSQTVLVLTGYRIVTALIGLSFAVLGYKLFCRGVYDKAGELKAAWGDRHLALKQAAPGTFFALFGVAVIVISLWRGIDIDVERAKSAASTPPQVSRQDRLETPSDRFVLLGEIGALIDKATEGKTLDERERKVLSQWLVKERMRFRVYEPPKKGPGAPA